MNKYMKIAKELSDPTAHAEIMAIRDACNTQPWKVEASENEIKVYRYRKEGKRGIMPKNMVIYYNQIDIGIFLCFLELCLENKEIAYDRELHIEENHEDEKNLTAIYRLKNNI